MALGGWRQRRRILRARVIRNHWRPRGRLGRHLNGGCQIGLGSHPGQRRRFERIRVQGSSARGEKAAREQKEGWAGQPCPLKADWQAQVGKLMARFFCRLPLSLRFPDIYPENPSLTRRETHWRTGLAPRLSSGSIERPLAGPLRVKRLGPSPPPHLTRTTKRLLGPRKWPSRLNGSILFCSESPEFTRNACVNERGTHQTRTGGAGGPRRRGQGPRLAGSAPRGRGWRFSATLDPGAGGPPGGQLAKKGTKIARGSLVRR